MTHPAQPSALACGASFQLAEQPVGNPQHGKLETCPTPLAGQAIGTPCADGPAICVSAAVLDQVLRYSETDMKREQGGFLLGGVIQDRRTCVEVRAFLPALAAASDAASLTFTHETWADMTRRAETEHPNELVVGWQHTHPGLGIFLSAYDLFIHRNFFGQPWQIALVVDPCQRQFAFFQWRNGEVVDCGFYYVASADQTT
jgi:proteasome lid subunit RPN8/RPN11